jgi:hypothetical protein
LILHCFVKNEEHYLEIVVNEHQSKEISKVSRRRALKKTTRNEHEADRLAPENVNIEAL